MNNKVVFSFLSILACHPIANAETVNVDTCEKHLRWQLNTSMYLQYLTKNALSSNFAPISAPNAYIICPKPIADVHRTDKAGKTMVGISCGAKKIGLDGSNNLYIKALTGAVYKSKSRYKIANVTATNPIPLVTPNYVQCVQDEYHKVTLEALKSIASE